MKNRSFTILIFAFVLITQSLFAQNKTNDLNTYFSALAENRQFNGNVLVAEKGKIIYEKSFGYADFPTKRLNTKNTAFPIASITKTITSTAVFQLVEKGKLNLSDPLVKFFPEFPYPEITISHLLSHTSGLTYYDILQFLIDSQSNKVFSNADFVSALVAKKKALLYKPGDSFNYDNATFAILALLVEKISGTPYDNYVKTNILKPAGMKNTFSRPFTLQGNPTNKENEKFVVSQFYPNYYSDVPIRANTNKILSGNWQADKIVGYGDYVSTTHDLLKYDEALYNGKLLKDATLTEAFTSVKLNNGKDNPLLYGLGWAVEKDTSFGKIVYHGGNLQRLSCVLLRNTTKRQTVIVYDVAQNIAVRSALNAIKILNGESLPIPKKSIAKIYGRVLVTEGKEAAKTTLQKLKNDTANYDLNEDELNTLGYDFVGDDKPFFLPKEPKLEEALEVFKITTDLFPRSWNAYDSYGEILLKTGQKEEAIKMYMKSIELNPNNESGKKILEELLKK
jgi:CubicO group peptidase (beta-lactamase class C family)